MRAEWVFQVTKRGYSSRARVVPEDLELSEVFEDAGVALPFELEPEPGVDGSELLLLPAEDVVLFKSREMAAGRACPSDSASASIMASS